MATLCGGCVWLIVVVWVDFFEPTIGVFFLDGCPGAEPIALATGTDRQTQSLDTYKAKRRRYHLYRAVARLWQQGVPWERALSIVTEAFNATTHEAA